MNKEKNNLKISQRFINHMKGWWKSHLFAVVVLSLAVYGGGKLREWQREQNIKDHAKWQANIEAVWAKRDAEVEEYNRQQEEKRLLEAAEKEKADQEAQQTTNPIDSQNTSKPDYTKSPDEQTGSNGEVTKATNKSNGSSITTKVTIKTTTKPSITTAPPKTTTVKDTTKPAETTKAPDTTQGTKRTRGKDNPDGITVTCSGGSDCDSTVGESTEKVGH